MIFTYHLDSSVQDHKVQKEMIHHQHSSSQLGKWYNLLAFVNYFWFHKSLEHMDTGLGTEFCWGKSDPRHRGALALTSHQFHSNMLLQVGMESTP